MSRHRRHSVYGDSSNLVVSALRDKIKLIEDEKGQKIDMIDPERFGAIVHQEQILVNKKTRTIRKAYMIDHRYKIGWVVDWDINNCMVCSAAFGWWLGRPKHHCRACGILVCHACSPYITTVPGINEFGGSRVCINCFGLKPGLFGTPLSKQQPSCTGTVTTRASEMYKSSPMPSPGNSFSYRNSESMINNTMSTPMSDEGHTPNGIRRPRNMRNRHSLSSSPMILSELGMKEEDINKEIEQYEREQQPLYEQDYLKMREFVPLDIYKTTLQRMVEQGLTEGVASRIWNCKALWLISTHPDDIRKIHLADFRAKYSSEGLDVMELRAIWHNLPAWDELSSNPLEVGKAEWRAGFKSRMDNQIYKMHAGTLPENLKRNPVYEECDLKHIYDPTIPLRTRYERSASQHRHAVESPMDAHYQDATRTQQVPHQVPRGSVREKTRAYLSNYEDAPLEDISEDWDEEEVGEYEDDLGDEYVYDYQEGDSQLISPIEHEEGIAFSSHEGHRSGAGRDGRNKVSSSKSPESRSVRSTQSQDRRVGRFPDLLQDINAEAEQDADSYIAHSRELQRDGNDEHNSYREDRSERSERQRAVRSTAAGTGSARNPHQHHPVEHYRMNSEHSVGSGSDNRSHGSFHYRTGPSVPSSGTSSHVLPGGIEEEDSMGYSAAGNRSAVSKRSLDTTTASTHRSHHSSVPVQSPSTAMRSPGRTANSRSSRHSLGGGGGDISPTPSGNSQTRSVAASRTTADIPAYAHNVPNSFVPRRSDASKSPVPVTSPSRNATQRSSAVPITPYPSMYGDITSVSVNSDDGTGQLSSSFSARRLEREQARRMRTATARAEAAVTDLPELGTGVYDSTYELPAQYSGGTQSPTSSLSSHNDSTTRSLPRTTTSTQPTATTTAYSNTATKEDNRKIEAAAASTTHSETSTVQEAAVSVAPSAVPFNSSPHPSTPTSHTITPFASKDNNTPKQLQHNYNSNHNTDNNSPAEDGSQSNKDNNSSVEDDSESYMTDDDDLSFNTAEEMDTPMFQRHQTTTRTTGKRGTRTPKSAFRKNHKAGSEVNINEARDELIKNLMIGNANIVTDILKTIYNAVPIIPIEEIISPIQASELMLQCYKEESLSLIQADQTLKILIDTLHANVNYIEKDSNKILLHYITEQNEKKLGKILISKGADIFHPDSTATCPLALNFSQKLDWVLREFQQSGREITLLQSADMELKLKYTTYLIYAGYSTDASNAIKVGNLQISTEDASHLFASCRGNFENMKDPIETFELLESLGATF